ncbi:hypothetical protein [Deinococcus ruber]|uniref:Uncharacterized protein n=1 Tax=Deinococcus ruber TaxID=1848197 RepID=A0A918KXE7_9DEIO|nr:hypothetical protein [Deinococcus ruber]GGR39441.1 hypothetical protein GCM10008957_55380 [Deinococcus ruber]
MSTWRQDRHRPRAVQPVDLTTDVEYAAVLHVLPAHLRKIVWPFIHRIEEIVLDKNGYLNVKFDGVRITYDF